MTSQTGVGADFGAAAPGAQPDIGPAARIGFGELSIVPDGEEFIVGDPAAGVFLALPEVGVTAIEQLRSGSTVGEVELSLAEITGQEVLVGEFVTGLIEAGIVRSVDGVPLGSAAAKPAARRWIAGVRPEHARLLFGRAAWLCYGACAAWCVIVLAFLPEYRPSFETFLFYPDPAVSMAVIAAAAILLGSVHEVWHWLAARAEGAGVRFAFSRRAFLPVLETDLTQLWATSRHRRYGPLLAGLAFDVTVMAVCLALRVAAQPLGLAPVLTRFIAVIVVLQVVAVMMQCMVFLRTDLYLVISTALGCQDLLRITRLYLKSKLWRVSDAERAALDGAHPRDRRVAPWFAAVHIIGIGVLAWLFVNLWLPATAVTGGWVVLGLWHANVRQRTFWEGLMIAVILLSQAAWPLAVYLKERFVAKGQPT